MAAGLLPNFYLIQLPSRRRISIIERLANDCRATHAPRPTTFVGQSEGRCGGGGLRASMFSGENRGRTDWKLIKQPRSKAEITGATFSVFVDPVAVALRSAGLSLPGHIAFFKAEMYIYYTYFS